MSLVSGFLDVSQGEGRFGKESSQNALNEGHFDRNDSRFPYMGVSKNTGTPKWMVYNGKPY